MVKVNGELFDYDGKTIAEIAKLSGNSTDRIAVELNEEIVPKARYGEVVAKDGDVLEIVRFVGGG